MEKYFTNKIEFENFLRTKNIFVPKRNEERKKEHVEWYTLINYFRTMSLKHKIAYPFFLIHEDKPDFILSFPTSKIGIEVTESTSEQLARARFLLMKNYPTGRLEPEFFYHNSNPKKNDEIRRILEKSNICLHGEPSYGTKIEQNWLDKTIECINIKTSKLNSSHFRKYEENWLLIYDNYINLFDDEKFVHNQLEDFYTNNYSKTNKICFDKIVIESGCKYYILQNNSVFVFKWK